MYPRAYFWRALAAASLSSVMLFGKEEGRRSSAAVLSLRYGTKQTTWEGEFEVG